ncbi:MAG TPA: hypothetical protein VLE94_19360, partial [Burkholderiaceae bacterium]|nr:hypothetical protein [Burkholderiaceae bacterium]
IVGYTPGPNEAAPHARQEIVGGDYFRTMQIPVVRGRVFDERDAADAPPVVDGSLNCQGYGSSVAVTATFGMVAAGDLMHTIARGGRRARPR